jgi:hypothetical protein
MAGVDLGVEGDWNLVVDVAGSGLEGAGAQAVAGEGVGLGAQVCAVAGVLPGAVYVELHWVVAVGLVNIKVHVCGYVPG